MATPSRPTLRRAWFIIVNMARMPPFSSPTRKPTAPSPSPYDITQVGLAWMPSLCSIETQSRSLRAPGEPSAAGRCLGTRKQLMPLVPGGAPGVRASTRCTMLSARSCSP